MRRDPVLGAMPNRPHQQIDPFQAPKGALDFRQTLVAAYRVFGGETLGGLARAQPIKPDQLRLLHDRTLPTFTPISAAARGFFFRRATSLPIFAKLFSVASSSASRLRLRSTSSSGLWQTTSRSPA